MNNKQKVIELIFYVLIVIVGVVLLVLGKLKNTEPPRYTTPPAQTSNQRSEGGIFDAAIPNQ